MPKITNLIIEYQCIILNCYCSVLGGLSIILVTSSFSEYSEGMTTHYEEIGVGKLNRSSNNFVLCQL